MWSTFLPWWRSMKSFGATCRRLSGWLAVGWLFLGILVERPRKKNPQKSSQWSQCRIQIRRLCLIPWRFFVDWLLRQRHKSYFHPWVTWPWKFKKWLVIFDSFLFSGHGSVRENQTINFDILRFATFAPWHLPQSLGRTLFWLAITLAEEPIKV